MRALEAMGERCRPKVDRVTIPIVHVTLMYDKGRERIRDASGLALMSGVRGRHCSVILLTKSCLDLVLARTIIN